MDPRPEPASMSADGSTEAKLGATTGSGRSGSPWYGKAALPATVLTTVLVGVDVLGVAGSV